MPAELKHGIELFDAGSTQMYDRYRVVLNHNGIQATCLYLTELGDGSVKTSNGHCLYIPEKWGVKIELDDLPEPCILKLAELDCLK